MINNLKIDSNSSFIKQKLTLLEIKLDDAYSNFLEEIEKISSTTENNEMAKEISDKYQKEMGDINKDILKIVAIDARGFLLASALAYKLGAGIVVARKKGKLPHKTIACEYDLEYGKEILEIHKDSIKAGEKVLIIDDVLATGGTALAATRLAEKLKAKIIGVGFLIELKFLNGREKLKKYKIFSLVNY